MVKHPTPWEIVIDGEGANVYDAERNLIIALSHREDDMVSLWYRIVDAVNGRDEGA